MRKTFFHSALLIVLFPLGLLAAQVDTTGFHSRLLQAYSETNIRAVAFGFVTGSGQYYQLGLGPAIWSEEPKLSDQHIFRIASMTKAITSVALLQLAEKGLIGLDDFAGDYLPELDLIPLLGPDGNMLPPGKRIRVRHLLTHTSGFGYSFMHPRLARFVRPEDYAFSDLPRLHEAGEKWTYGTSTDWVGQLVERVSGLNLEAYFRKFITGPLEMNSTWFNVPEELHPMVVSFGVRPVPGRGEIRETPRRITRESDNYSGGAGLHSSLSDYLIFLRCILRGGESNGVRILGKEMIDEMFTDQLPALMHEHTQPPETPGGSSRQVAPDQMRHSLSWALETEDNAYGRRAGSGYWSGIFNTFYSIDRETGIAVVMMTNFMPFGDEEALGLYKLFESMVRLP